MRLRALYWCTGIGVGFHVRDTVGSKTTVAGLLSDARSGIGVSAGFHVDQALPGNDFSVLRNTGLDQHPSGMARNGFKTLFNRMGEPHRSLRFPGQGCRQRLGFDRELSAIGAAEIGRNDTDLVERKTEDIG